MKYMTLGQLRAITASMPDDAIVASQCEHDRSSSTAHPLFGEEWAVELVTRGDHSFVVLVGSDAMLTELDAEDPSDPRDEDDDDGFDPEFEARVTRTANAIRDAARGQIDLVDEAFGFVGD